MKGKGKWTIGPKPSPLSSSREDTFPLKKNSACIVKSRWHGAVGGRSKKKRKHTTIYSQIIKCTGHLLKKGDSQSHNNKIQLI